MREEVFPFHAELAANGVTDFMDGTRLAIDEPTVLTQVVSKLNDLHLDRVDADTKGDLFEHVLRQIRQAGGQFRTPRHVIRALVRLVDPRIGESTIRRPARPVFWSARGTTSGHGADGTPVPAIHAQPRAGAAVSSCPKACCSVPPAPTGNCAADWSRTTRSRAVLALPGGVFNPYSGVKTSVLVFRRGGATGRVMFLHAENDGFKFDAHHDQLIEKDDLPGLIEAFRDRDARWTAWHTRDPDADWTENCGSPMPIRAADFNLSANRHRPQSRAKIEHRDPLNILDELRSMDLGSSEMILRLERGPRPTTNRCVRSLHSRPPGRSVGATKAASQSAMEGIATS